MGMESYFVTIEIVNCSLTEQQLKDYLRQNYKVTSYLMPTGNLFKRYVRNESRFVIDKKATVTTSTTSKGLSISFQLCFSNYNQNVTYIFDVCKSLCLLESGCVLVLMNNQYDFNALNIDEFRALLLQSHKDKRDTFVKKYGEINCDILPQYFYECIKYLKV